MPISANTNGWSAPKERKSLAWGTLPAWYATCQPAPALPSTASMAFWSAAPSILCQPFGTLK